MRRRRRRRWWWWWGFCSSSCAGFLTSETRITSKLYSWNSRSPLVATRPKLATTTAVSSLQIFDCNRSGSGATQTKTDSTTNGKAVVVKRALYDKTLLLVCTKVVYPLTHCPPRPPNSTQLPSPPFLFVFLFFFWSM
jgi:hypothetical protein